MKPRLQLLAKNAVHKLLRKLRYGCLKIQYQDQLEVFGDPQSELQATVVVESLQAYQLMAMHGILGAGEGYIGGLWRSPDLLSVVRVFSANLEMMAGVNQHRSWMSVLSARLRERFTRNSLSGSRKNILAHYDLNNDFFATFLDRKMMYSSAIYPTTDTDLEAAAEHKLRHICETLQISASDRVVEIGSGWGGFAVFAAQHYGCKVTTITISDAQYQYVVNLVQQLNLADRVEVKLCDYRELQGEYDKLVSIEMIEAVGHRYFETYFKKCASLLKPDGSMLIQAITIADQRYDQARDAIDFIKHYIFPGGCLPSLAVISAILASQTDLQLVKVDDITHHYSRTLADWRQRFHRRRDDILNLGFNHEFLRMWEYYLCYCEGGFSERIISTVQLVAARPGCRELPAVR